MIMMIFMVMTYLISIIIVITKIILFTKRTSAISVSTVSWTNISRLVFIILNLGLWFNLSLV